MTEAQAKHMDSDPATSMNRIHGTGTNPKHKDETEKTDKYDTMYFPCGKQRHFAKNFSGPTRVQNSEVNNV
jgi:hypothetical protein